MFGLRRIGKSTLRRHLQEVLAAEGRQVAFIDGQGLHSLAAFLSGLSSETGQDGGLWGRALKAVASGPAQKTLAALGQGEKLEAAALSAYWQHVATAIKAALADGARPVLIVDEFSYLIQNMVNGDGAEDVDRLLGSMREWREAGMQMLLTGSIGVTQLARRQGLNLEHLNDLQQFSVPELTDEEARQFIASATYRAGPRWTEKHTEAFMAECSALYPCFLVKGLQEVGTEYPVTPEQFANVFELRVRPDLHADFYEQFNKRFHQYRSLSRNELTGLILPALKTIMTAEGSTEQGELLVREPFTRVDLDVALGMLVEDGFAHFSEDREGNRFWKPGSRLAHNWWRRAKLL
ncbi:hypothetical protein SAMN04488245_104317 [Alloyangia pacifica]|uniref:ORC1/DEAH AAA+ ATPase domain-containing protein n=2 Tax=Alloyangia pacifica TaxID=311180 RepID=A0A1I6SF26_9RHOB|nr:hypothetical protein SAMN04488245_104317 [Alloyangia pacifica]SFS75420.1 hypothetical protein SAMN04488050_104317 [Alloyangia pacifica]